MSGAVVAQIGQHDPVLRGINDVRNDCLNGWKPIPDVQDPGVQEIAEFAVTQHNIQHKENLKYKWIVCGWYVDMKEHAGMEYRLILEVADFLGRLSKYKVAVSEIKSGGEKIKKLESFKHIPSN